MRGDSAAPPIPHCRSLSLLVERSACTLWAADSDTYGGAVTVTVYNRRFDAAADERFDAAVEAATQLGRHPNLVSIYGSGRLDDGRAYVVGDGHERTTAQGLVLTGGVLDVERVLRMGIALAGALETAHRAGVVHGGVSPALVLVGADGRPVLTEVALAEFGRPAGISALFDHSIPYHAPPEVLESTELSPATDVYSLASVVYTLLVGDPPHAAHGVVDSTASLLLRILQMPMPTIQRSDVPPGLEDTLRTALAHEPGKRPQQVLELAWALQEAQRLAGMDVSEPVVLDGLGGAGGFGLRITGPAAAGATAGGGQAGAGAAGAGAAGAGGPSVREPGVWAEAGAVPAAGALSGLDLGAALAAPAGGPVTITPAESPPGGYGPPGGIVPGEVGAAPGTPGPVAPAVPGPAPTGISGPLPAAIPDTPVVPLVEARGTDDVAEVAGIADPLAEGAHAPPPSGPLYPGRLGDRPLASGPLGHAPLDDLHGAPAPDRNGQPRDDLFGPPTNAGTNDPFGPPTSSPTDDLFGPPTSSPADDLFGTPTNAGANALFGPPMNGRAGDGDGSPGDGAPRDGRAGIVGRELGDGPRPASPPPGAPTGGIPGAAGSGAFGPLAPWAAPPPAGEAEAEAGHNSKRANGLLRRNGANGSRRTSAGRGGDAGRGSAADGLGAGAPANGTSRAPGTQHGADGPGGPGPADGHEAPGERPWWAIFGATTVPEAEAAPGRRRSQGTPDPSASQRNGSATARAATAAASGRSAGAGEHTSALERARAGRLERQRSAAAGGAAASATSPGGGTSTRDRSSSGGGGTAEQPAQPSEDLGHRVGPPALPVIVLVALVVVLGIGGAYLVVTGENAPDDAATSPQRQVTATSTTVAPQEPTGPSNLRAVETNDGGVQLDWDGPDAAYTVRILAVDAPPRAVPGGPATALMIPAPLLTSSGGMCFEVAEAPAQSPTAAPPGAAGPATTPTSAAAPGASGPTTTAAGAAASTTTAPGAAGSTTTAAGATTTSAGAPESAEVPVACVRGATPAAVRRQ
jgi:hypothetical protein